MQSEHRYAKKSLVFFVVAATNLASIGCGIRTHNPEPRAAQSLACNQGSITSEEVAYWTWVVTGCGKKDVLSLDGAGKYWTSLRDRAAFEMSCGVAELEITVIGGDSFGVVGCGKKAVYLYAQGKFILQSESKTTGAETAAASSEPTAPAK